MICSGVFTALITPFDSKGNIDLEGFVFHLKRQKKAGVDGVVVLGTTAEAVTLTPSEKEILVKLARQECDLPLMVGCSSSSIAQTIDNVQAAKIWGADSVLICAPFYIKPTQEGIFKYFEEIHDRSQVPILAYNNPSRCAVNIEVDTLNRMADLPRICGVKECSENIAQVSEIFYTIKKKRPDFAFICGDDILTYALMALGADGVISGGANLIPEQMVALLRALKEGEIEKARSLNCNLFPIFQVLRMESHPIPLKAALQFLQLPSGDPRSPLTPLSSKHKAALEKAIQWLSAIHAF